MALGCNWVAIEAVERLQDRRPSDRQCVPTSVVLEPFTNVMNKGHEANKLLTKSDEHDLPTPRWKCRYRALSDMGVSVRDLLI